MNKHIRVLFVDGDKRFVDKFRYKLCENSIYDIVDTVSTDKGILDRMFSLRPEVVILDCETTNIDPNKFIPEILNFNHSIKVIVDSKNSQICQRCKDNGAAAVFVKPYESEIDEFVNVVSNKICQLMGIQVEEKAPIPTENVVSVSEPKVEEVQPQKVENNSQPIQKVEVAKREEPKKVEAKPVTNTVKPTVQQEKPKTEAVHVTPRPIQQQTTRENTNSSVQTTRAQNVEKINSDMARVMSGMNSVNENARRVQELTSGFAKKKEPPVVEQPKVEEKPKQEEKKGFFSALFKGNKNKVNSSHVLASEYRPERVIALGASTGGTDALEVVLKGMPEGCPPIVVVQHMPPDFTRMFAERLNRNCSIEIREAVNGDRLCPGLCFIAAGDKHMRVKRDSNGYYVQCEAGEKVSGHCPSVDVLFASVADSVGRDAVGALLTGMGADGAKGMKRMHDKGAYTVGQDKESCVVYGMPMEAYKLGACSEQASLNDVSKKLLEHCKK